MRKLILFLLAVTCLTACVQAKENDRGARYMNITAAKILVELGYINIREFGGIIDWAL